MTALQGEPGRGVIRDCGAHRRCHNRQASWILFFEGAFHSCRGLGQHESKAAQRPAGVARPLHSQRTSSLAPTWGLTSTMDCPPLTSTASLDSMPSRWSSSSCSTSNPNSLDLHQMQSLLRSAGVTLQSCSFKIDRNVWAPWSRCLCRRLIVCPLSNAGVAGETEAAARNGVAANLCDCRHSPAAVASNRKAASGASASAIPGLRKG